MTPRLRRHLGLASVVAAPTAVAVMTGPAGAALDRASMVTAWACMALFVTALAIGPLRVLAGAAPPLNLLVRRDLGIWAALTGLAHFWLGTAQSMNVAYLQTHVTPPDLPFAAETRAALFTWGSLGGLAVGVFCVLLLLLSNNRALELLGPRWWKRLQRTSYLAFALTVAHGLAFQALERRTALLVAALLLAGAAVLAIQLAGRRRVRERAAERS